MNDFKSVTRAIDALQEGEMVIVVDDKERENEGDFIMAAEKITPEAVNFMAKEGRGLICVAITAERAEKLDLKPMEKENTALHNTSFTVSVDYLHDTTTGISAHDRAVTIQAIVSETSQSDEFGRPGHIFPIVAKEGGVLRRAGHTEAAVDLAQLSGLKPAGVLCEIMSEDGSMARLPELQSLAEQFDIPIVSIAELIEYRQRNEQLIKHIETVKLPTNEAGRWNLHLYQNLLDDSNHVALVKGNIDPEEPVLVRVHSECLTGDVFGSQRCDCGQQLDYAMDLIEKEGKGVILYLRQEGRG
ncbi:MAG: 3,4-dihydroxy-2-butanone-4-phosphate synthase, partial [Candidatus Marinimicrobia bacterium]|nr:3,4-dihydroxy-2-butanone-4-phosphate synthase [Candidatus Neomarinimicrobiota bacterium]